MIMSTDAFKLVLFTIGVTVFVALLFNGGFAGSNVISTNEFPTVTGQDTPNNEPNYGDINEELKLVADKAISNLLNTPNLSLFPQQIKVVGVTEETYADGSLGCSQEGMVYTQAIVPGYKVILEADGKTYDYRLDKTEQIVLCEK